VDRTNLRGIAVVPPAMSCMTIEYIHDAVGSLLPLSFRIVDVCNGKANPHSSFHTSWWGSKKSGPRVGWGVQLDFTFRGQAVLKSQEVNAFICHKGVAVAASLNGGGIVRGRHSTASQGEGSALLQLHFCLIPPLPGCSTNKKGASNQK